MFIARATTMIASKRLAADWTIMSSFTPGAEPHRVGRAAVRSFHLLPQLPRGRTRR